MQGALAEVRKQNAEQAVQIAKLLEQMDKLLAENRLLSRKVQFLELARKNPRKGEKVYAIGYWRQLVDWAAAGVVQTQLPHARRKQAPGIRFGHHPCSQVSRRHAPAGRSGGAEYTSEINRSGTQVRFVRAPGATSLSRTEIGVTVPLFGSTATMR